jgi:hypothetical protein
MGRHPVAAHHPSYLPGLTNQRPPVMAPPDTASDDPRLGHIIGRAVARGAGARVVMVGFPSDEGVRRNGGRPGGAAGPPAHPGAV